jgi:3-oxoacyl-[acyl-carrier-protein] synthase-1
LRVVAPLERLGRAPRHVLSNSFAFGGSNVSLLLGSA